MKDHTDCVEVLRFYNAWRRGEGRDSNSPYSIGVAIDEALAELEMRRRGECICRKCGQPGVKTETTS